MADRFPLVANSSTSQIQEIPSGDTLDLSGNNVKGVGIITATTFSGNVTGTSGGLSGTPNITVGTVTGTDATFSGNLTVNGTTTTIDTAITEVDSLNVEGSVGIGTTNPSHKLNVYDGDIAVTKRVAASGGNDVQMVRLRVSNPADNNTTTLGGISAETVSSWGGDLTFHTKTADGNPGTNVSERLRITSDGRLLLGTSDAGGNNTANHLVVSNNAGANDQAGISIRGGTSGRSQIFFSDGTSGQDEYRGMLRYDHQDNSMQFRTNATERVRIGSSGEIGLSGANYGTAGQVLTSQGSGSAPQWAAPAASGGTSAGTRYTNPNTTTVEWTSLPANIQTIDVGYGDAYASSNNAENERIVLRLGTSGGYVTSNYNNRSWNMYQSSIGLGFNATKSAFIPYYWIDNTDRATAMFTLRRMGTSNTFQAQWHEYIGGGHAYIATGGGYVDLGAELTQVKLQTINSNASLNGSFWINYSTR